MEDGVGHQRRQHRGQPDQVLAIGAIAVQQHDEMAGLAASVGTVTGSLKLLAFELFHFFSAFGGLALQSGMLRR